MTDYPLKTPSDKFAENPLAPAFTDLVLAWQDGAMGAMQWQAVFDLFGIAAKAPLNSPALTGTPTAPTAPLGTNTTQIATMAAVKAALDDLLAGAPGALDTLNELAAALGDDANFAATMTTALAGKQPLDAQLTALAGLTGAAGAFVRWTGAASAVMQPIVGTVSRSGSIPTGAIIERGSNANGEYVRWADGTQICTHEISISNVNTAAGSLYSSTAESSWTFPASFLNPPALFGGDINSENVWVPARSNVASYGEFRAFSYTAINTVRVIKLAAIGRWF